IVPKQFIQRSAVPANQPYPNDTCCCRDQMSAVDLLFKIKEGDGHQHNRLRGHNDDIAICITNCYRHILKNIIAKLGDCAIPYPGRLPMQHDPAVLPIQYHAKKNNTKEKSTEGDDPTIHHERSIL